MKKNTNLPRSTSRPNFRNTMREPKAIDHIPFNRLRMQCSLIKRESWLWSISFIKMLWMIKTSRGIKLCNLMTRKVKKIICWELKNISRILMRRRSRQMLLRISPLFMILKLIDRNVFLMSLIITI